MSVCAAERHESPYPAPPPPIPGPLARVYAAWPMVLSMACGALALMLMTADLLADWTITAGAMPAYAALLAVATGGAVLGRK